mgnify:CR=1 FL=1
MSMSCAPATSRARPQLSAGGVHRDVDQRDERVEQAVSRQHGRQHGLARERRAKAGDGQRCSDAASVGRRSLPMRRRREASLRPGAAVAHAPGATHPRAREAPLGGVAAQLQRAVREAGPHPRVARRRRPDDEREGAVERALGAA